MKNINDLYDQLNKTDHVNGVVPFWFLNHFPEEAEIRKQVREIAEHHCKGTMLHARDGLLGGYLNGHWKKAVGWAIDEAKKQNISVWLYDELNYPSGPAGGKLFDICPDTAMQSLELISTTEAPAEETFDRVVKYNGKYLNFTIRYQRQYPDYLDKKVMKEFVKLSYTWYHERFGKDFGSKILGEFTDNSCANFGYHRRSIPWTDKMPELFREKTGYEIDNILPSLFLQTGEMALHRLIFWRFLNELYLETFIIPIEEECAKNGIAATGHYCIESGVSEHVRQLGDRFDQKRHQQIPGVDMLGGGTWEALGKFPIGTPSTMMAMTASPAYFYHNSSVLCECLGLSMKWAMTLAEVKRITGTLAALGVNIFVPHGLYYSISGHRKRECIPDFYHNTMWEHLGGWAEWIGKIGTLTANADEHIAETALLYPVTAQQASIEVGVGAPYKDLGDRCMKIDRLWSATGDLLVKNAIPFEVISEDILCSGKVCGDELQITLPNGNIHKIHTIVLVSSWIIGDKAYQKLREFANAGGCIISEGEKLSATFDGKKISPASPDIFTASFDADDIASLEKTDLLSILTAKRRNNRVQLSGGAQSLALKEWIKDGQYFALVQNYTRNRIEKVEISCKFTPVVIDLENAKFYRAKNNIIQKTFEYGETLLLTDCEGELPELPAGSNRPEQIHTLNPAQWTVTMETPNAFLLREMVCEADINNTERHLIWEFDVASMPGKLGIGLDLEQTMMEMRNGITPFTGRFYSTEWISRAKAFVNDTLVKNIRFGTNFDRWIYEADITPFIRQGKNIVRITLPNGLLENNRTFPEPLMLTGSFGVVNGSITPAPSTLPAPVWHDSPLADYSGTMRFTAKIQIPENMRNKPLALVFHDVREIVEVMINGESCGSRFMPPWQFMIPEKFTDLEEWDLTLRISNTPANRWQTPLPSGVNGNIEIHSF